MQIRFTLAIFKNDTHKWLVSRKIKNCNSLNSNLQFIDFLREKFPGKSVEEINAQISQCCQIAKRIKFFSTCIETALA
jgi:hypothetical protein